jgi:adenylate kinase
MMELVITSNICSSHFFQSQPVEDFYQKQGKVLEFDLPGGIPESWPKLLQVLNLEDQEELKLATA